MEIFTRLQESSFAAWVASSPSLLAYPSILTLHTVGMAIVVGTCVVMDLRVLGVGADVPLSSLQRAPRLVWTGFFINAATGMALFTTDAEHKAMQTVFYVKLTLIFLALVTYARIRKLLFRAPQPTVSLSAEARTLAVISLLLWTAATVAGRLMAYLL